MKKFLFILSMTALLALQANAETLLGDLNGDNEVNITDVNLLTSAISAGNNDAIYDLNGDGSVNITDLSALLEIAMAVAPEPDFDIDSEHATGWWIVLIDAEGNHTWYQLREFEFDSNYITTITLCFYEYGEFYWDPDLSYEENEANRPAAPFCFVIDGVRYGPSIPMMPTYVISSKYYRWPAFSYGNPANPLVRSNKYYTLPVGFSYVLGIGIDEDGGYYVIAATGPNA